MLLIVATRAIMTNGQSERGIIHPLRNDRTR
jgi:hypothetical protein